MLQNGSPLWWIGCWDILKLSVENTYLYTHGITRWLHHSSKQSNETFDMERLAWQAIASPLVMKHLNMEFFIRAGKKVIKHGNSS